MRHIFKIMLIILLMSVSGYAQTASTIITQRADTIGDFVAFQVTAIWPDEGDLQEWQIGSAVEVVVRNPDMDIVFHRNRSMEDYPELFNRCGDTLLFQDLYFIPNNKLDSASSIYIGLRK